MKLKVIYDLIYRIKESKKGFCIEKRAKSNFIASLPVPLIHFFISKDMLDLLLRFTYMNVAFNIYDVIYNSVVTYKKEKNIQNAIYDLRLLTNQLRNLDVKTTVELLQESRVIQTNYEINYKDGMLPALAQKKYITVPLTNGYEETILQEHVFGDQDYEISVQSPVKEHKFKLDRVNA